MRCNSVELLVPFFGHIQCMVFWYELRVFMWFTCTHVRFWLHELFWFISIFIVESFVVFHLMLKNWKESIKLLLCMKFTNLIRYIRLYQIVCNKLSELRKKNTDYVIQCSLQFILFEIKMQFTLIAQRCNEDL